MNFLNKDPLDFVHESYTVNTYLSCYSNLLSPINGRDLWPMSRNAVLLPPDVKIRLGRPKKARRRESDEAPVGPTKLRKIGVQMRCKNCGEVGHNKRGCKQEKVLLQRQGRDTATGDRACGQPSIQGKTPRRVKQPVKRRILVTDPVPHSPQATTTNDRGETTRPFTTMGTGHPTSSNLTAATNTSLAPVGTFQSPLIVNPSGESSVIVSSKQEKQYMRNGILVFFQRRSPPTELPSLAKSIRSCTMKDVTGSSVV